MKSSELSSRYEQFRKNWHTLSLYERFEQGTALILTILIAAIIVVAMLDLTKEVLSLALQGVLHPLDHKVFQVLFGQIMTVLIALEFNHSIVRVVMTGKTMVQVRIVLLIALLALARKFIILDVDEYEAGTIFALAAVVIALGASYRLIRDRNAQTIIS